MQQFEKLREVQAFVLGAHRTLRRGARRPSSFRICGSVSSPELSGSSDKFTLYLTSNPTDPEYNGQPIDKQNAAEIAADIEERFRVSDRPANLADALLEVEKGIEGQTGASLNQIVYVVSDMRKSDWPTDRD